MTVSPQENNFSQRFSELLMEVSKIERAYAQVNLKSQERIYPNLSQAELTDKVNEGRLEIVRKLYTLFPNLESDTKMTPESMVKDIRHASSRIYTLSDKTRTDMALAESGMKSGTSDGLINIEPFISEIQVAIPTGAKRKEFIKVEDDDDPTKLNLSTDFLEVDEYRYETVSVIKDRQMFENTINNIVQQAVTKATAEVDNQLENFNILLDQAQDNKTDNVGLSRDQIRFEAAKLFQELSSGADIKVDNGTDVIVLNLANTNKQLTAKIHYLDLLEDLQKNLLEANGIKLVEDTKLVAKRIALEDGTFITKDVPEKVIQYKIEQYGASSFGRTLFNAVKHESQDENGNMIATERKLFHTWVDQLHKELGQDINSFLSNPSNLIISQANDSKVYDLFIGSMDKANIETPRLTGGMSQNDDWEPLVPMNKFRTPETQKGLMGEVNDILNNSNKAPNNGFLMSNFNTNTTQTNNQQNTQVNGQLDNKQQAPLPQDTIISQESIKNLNLLQDITSTWTL